MTNGPYQFWLALVFFNMSLLKKLAGETAIYGLSSIVGRFINFLLVPLYTRMFSPTEYGVVSELFSYAGFIMVLFSYRLESAFFRFGNEEKERANAYSTALLSLLGTTAVLLSLLLLFSDNIADALDYGKHPEYIRYFALILALDCVSELPFARLRLEQKPVRFVIAKFLNIGVNVSLNLFWIVFCPWAVSNGHDWVRAVWSPQVGVGYVFLANVVASAVTLLFLLPQMLGISHRFDKVLWKKMMAYSWPLVITGFAGIVNEMLDRAIMVRLLPGTEEANRAQLGIYSANYKLAMLISLFTQAYRYAAEPFFFRTSSDGDALRIQANATKWFTIAGSVGMLGILLYLDILKDFLGTKFHLGLHIVPILLLANLFLGLFYSFSVWYRLKDKTKVGAWIGIGGALLTVVLNVWWVPLMGYVGAAWATLVCYACMAGATWYLGKDIHPVPYPLLRIALFVAVALGLYAVSVWVKPLMPASMWVVLGFNTVLMAVYLLFVVKEYKKA
jgi:O-antigen/teichoic acid export membrane protein